MALGHMMKKLSFPIPDQIKAAKTLTFAQVAAVAPPLFKKTFFEGFFAGQIEPEHAKAVWRPVMDLLYTGTGAVPLPKSQIRHATMRRLPQQPMYKHEQGPTAGNAAVLMVDAGGLDCKGREALDILYEAIPNRFYADLRSKQQTGYLVQASTEVLVSHHNVINFVVQSSKYKPGDLLHRYSKFLKDTLLDLESKKSKTLSAEKFAMIKASKLAKYATPNLNIGSLTSIMQTLISNYDGDFDALIKKKHATEQIQHADVLKVAQKVHGAHNRRQVAVVYTKAGDKLDQLPKQFVAFDGSKGRFVSREPFKCNIGGLSTPVVVGAKHVIKTKQDTTSVVHSAAPAGKATAGGDVSGPITADSAPGKGIKEASSAQ